MCVYVCIGKETGFPAGPAVVGHRAVGHRWHSGSARIWIWPVHDHQQAVGMQTWAARRSPREHLRLHHRLQIQHAEMHAKCTSRAGRRRNANTPHNPDLCCLQHCHFCCQPRHLLLQGRSSRRCQGCRPGGLLGLLGRRGPPVRAIAVLAGRPSRLDRA